MRKGVVFSIVAVAAFVAVSAAGAEVRRSLARISQYDGVKDGDFFPGPAYRSPGTRHKIVINGDDTAALERALASGAIQVADYGSFKLMTVDQPALDDLQREPAINRERRQFTGGELPVRDDFNLLLLRSRIIDTTTDDAMKLSVDRSVGSTSGSRRLRLIHFVGPVKRVWLDQLRKSGFEPIAYVPNNGYLVRSNDPAQATERLTSAIERSGGESFIQWQGTFNDQYKVHPSLRTAEGEVIVALQVARSERSAADVESAARLANSVIGAPSDVLGFTDLRLKVHASKIAELAALEDVVNIEPWQPPQLFDERSSQIVAGELTSDGKQARGPGYLAWLEARGLGSQLGFSVDVTDTGLDRGSTQAASLHPDFLDSSGQSRINYARDYTSELDPGDPLGHGTLNLSIVGGLNTSADKDARDALNFSYGLGVAPSALLGSSRIFRADGQFDLIEPFSKVISEAYRDGARVSSNSWGVPSNSYMIDSQEYDLRVRDAAPAEPGNQEMTICFAVGNGGSLRSVSSPGTGKNVISVAASENWRPGVDGCGVGDSSGDSAIDIASFSGSGPVDDGRSKPDITAPGTHIQGAASQHPDFHGSGVCGKASGDPYFPAGQKLYTWSSGTSHSTPQIAGAAALVRQFLLNRGEEPSSALIKALLAGTATYMTGEGAGGDLPHPRQGWGLVNLGRVFDSIPKILVNQSRTFSNSGEEFTITGEVKDASQPFRVTLVWTDAPGFSAVAPWVNDLDLEVTINGQLFRGNNFAGQESQPSGQADTRNNVEAVWLPAGTTGSFLIRVRAANIAGDGVLGNSDPNDQDFALVVYNGERKDVAVAALAGFTVSGGGDGVADPGESVSLKVQLKNVSGVALNGGRGAIASSTQGISVTSATSDFPNIAPGEVGESLAPFSFTIDKAVACGSEIQLVLSLSSKGSVSPLPFKLRVGTTRVARLFEDDLESSEAKWTHGSSIKKKKKQIDTWVISTKRFRSGGHSWFSPDLESVTDSHLDSLPIALPADARNIRLVFYHTFAFESGGFDGGVIEISTGGDFEDLGPRILRGRYNGTIFGFRSPNPLIGRPAWIEGRVGTFQEVVVDLDSFAGKTVVIRFRIGTDDLGKDLGWYVDDASITADQVSCTPAEITNK